MPPTIIELPTSPWFGAGGAEPYDHALRDPNRVLYVREASFDSAADARDEPVDVARFIGRADAADQAVLARVAGPVLDVGCGPGRIVRAAILAGHLAMGVDVSKAAVAMAQHDGLPVLNRSVFQSLPSEGTWGTVVLLDGNIGIGGDVPALLDRCRRLILDQGRGRVIVEAHPVVDHDRTFEAVAVDDLGRTSRPFAWAEVGPLALQRHASTVGLTRTHLWSHDRRTFVELASV